MIYFLVNCGGYQQLGVVLIDIDINGNKSIKREWQNSKFRQQQNY